MNNPQQTRDLILMLLRQRKSNTSKMLESIGFNQSLIFDMGKKNSMPAADKMGAIADYLDVSVDYLLGRTDKPEVNK